MSFYTANAEDMRLEADGDLHVDGDVIAYSTTISDERLKENIEYLISNDEGNFFRTALKMGFNLIDGSLMNAIMSHQSLIRPPFDGLFENTKRCPPGFSVEFSINRTELECFLINSEKKTSKEV